MALIYKLTDRVPVHIGDITIMIAPLTYGQKKEIMGNVRVGAGIEAAQSLEMGRLALKYSIKDVRGVHYPDGSEFKISFSGDSLSDETLDELYQLENVETVIKVCSALVRGIHDPGLEGVKVDLLNKSHTKKKKNQ